MPVIMKLAIQQRKAENTLLKKLRKGYSYKRVIEKGFAFQLVSF